jgi:hypothetical protein
MDRVAIQKNGETPHYLRMTLIFFLTKLMKGLSLKLEGEGGVLSRFV